MKTWTREDYDQLAGETTKLRQVAAEPSIPDDLQGSRAEIAYHLGVAARIARSCAEHRAKDAGMEQPKALKAGGA